MKKLIFLIFLLGIGITIFVLISRQVGPPLSDAEKKTAIKKMLGHEEVGVTVMPTGLKTYDGISDSFSYPAAFSRYTGYAGQQTASDTFRLYNKDTRAFFTTQMQHMDGTSIKDIPGVITRRQQKEIYTESPILIGGENGLEFQKTADEVEETAFVMHNGNLYTYSASGPRGIEELFRVVTSSVVFH